MAHKLQIIRRELGFTRCGFALSIGLAPSTIGNIEDNDGLYLLREETAEIICAALGRKISDIFEECELTNRGRMPLTGGGTVVSPRQAQASESLEMLCSTHYIMVPKGTGCSDCNTDK